MICLTCIQVKVGIAQEEKEKMTEYIDKETMRSIIRDEESKHGLMGCAWIEMAMDRQPAADVVEVVRCKDCLYSTEQYGHMECIHGVSYRNTWNKPDFFCPYGDRKEGAD